MSGCPAAGGVSLPVFISTVLTLLVFILGGMFKITRWFINRFAMKLDSTRDELSEELLNFKTELRNDLDELKSELSCLKKEFNAFTRSLPEKYVFKDNFSQDLKELKDAVVVVQRDFLSLSEKLAKATQRIANLERRGSDG